jgi:hypothetical protein
VRKLASAAFVCLLVISLPAHICQADIYPFQIFTDNGTYNDNPGWNLYVDVWDGTGVANFTFYNDSSFDSSIARIYFDDGTLLGIDEVINSVDPGPPKVTYTSFNTTQSPGDLPGGNLLDPDFVADREFSIGSLNPPPWKGVNNGDTLNEWVTVKFNLNGGTLGDVLAELDSGVLRVGIHVIGLPDGSSESAILIPEPATVLLLGLGALALLRKRRLTTNSAS